MIGIKQIWALLERTMCLKNNAGKQKGWSYLPPRQEAPAVFLGVAPTVLGVGLPAPARAATAQETAKTLTAQHQLRRVGSLPLRADYRRRVASIGPLSAATWARAVSYTHLTLPTICSV
eukprot:8298080-Alexandrium_andersonii.AAC.1